MKENYKTAIGSGKNDSRYTDRYTQMPKRELSALKDGRQASEVFGIDTDSEKYDMDRIRFDSVGTKGYPRQAFDYDY